MIKKLKTLIILSSIFILFFAENIHSQNVGDKGYLRGKITESGTGEPLEGANVILLGTHIGAATDENGNFLIRSIPQGKYTVQVSIIGYRNEEKANVNIESGAELEINFQLVTAAIEGPSVIVTASKKTQAYGDIPVSVSVLSKDFIKKTEHFKLSNSLRYVSGVNFTEDQVNIRNHAGYRRGTGSTVILMIDGIPLMPGDTGDIKWDIIPLENINRVEILKGPGSALYGSAAMGGVINIITEKPGTKKSTTLDFMGGFYDKPYYDEWKWSNSLRTFRGLNISHSFSQNKFKVLLSAGSKISDGYRQNDHSKRYHIFNKLKYEISSNEYLDIITNFAKENRGLFIQWEDWENVLKVKSRDLGNTVESDKFQASFNYYKLFSEKFGFNAKGYNFYTKFSSETQDGTDYSKSNRAGLEIQGDIKLADNHFITLGIEAVADNIKSNMFGKHGGFGTAVYMQDDYRLTENYKLTFGARFDYKKIDILDPEYQLSPKIGLTYQISKSSNIWISAGKGFRYPLISEAFMDAVVSGFVIEPNEDITSESSMSFEVGTNLKIMDRYRFEGALFLNKYDNMIEAYTDTTKKNLIFQNLTKAEIKGFEFTIAGSPLTQLNLSLNYTYTKSTDLTGGINEPLAYRPDHIINIMCETFYKFVKCGGNFRYISKTEKYKVYPHDKRVPLYLVDMWSSIGLGKNMSLNIKINNLLQYHYTEIERNLFPIRNISFSLRKKF
ncbi:TonB-dependent receptor domain-containing protein [candidate division KSB1 bacterium]